MTLRRFVPAAAAIVLAACGGRSDADPPVAERWTVTSLPSPAPAGSAQPQLTSADGRVLLSWIARDGKSATLAFADRTPDGWSPTRVVARGDDWFVNWADVPSVMRLPGRRLAAHWLQKSGAGTYAYDVRLAFSADDGQTWSASTTPHHDGTQTEHGFASLYSAPAGGLGLVWLDGRAMTGGHEGHGRGAMTLRGATFEAAGTQRSEVEIDNRVCECCPTAVTITADGPLVAFRNRSDEEVRDIYVTRWRDGAWTEPRPVHADNWRIPACPVNGPALASQGRRVAIAWFTMAAGQGQAFVAFSEDAGETFGAPIRVDDAGTLGRVDVELLDDGSAAVSWIEVVGQAAEFRVRRVTTADRGAPTTIAPLTSGRSSGYPRMARAGGELLFAWTESGDTPQVRTAAITLR